MQETSHNEEAPAGGAEAVPDAAPGDPEADDDGFSERVLDSFVEIFWEPEIQRRGGVEVTGPVYAALAVMVPGEPVEVRFNDEVMVVAKAKPDSPTAPGDPVTADNLDDGDDFEPVDVDPNAGWVMWLVLPNGHQYARFDFSRNRARSLRLLELARSYMAAAQGALETLSLGPALENAMAAAELAITAQSYTFTTEAPASGGGRNSHSSRKHWTKVQAGLGNTTPDAHHTLVELGKVRPAARYGEGELPPPARVGELLTAVENLLDHAAARVGSLLRTQNPAFLARVLSDQPTMAETPPAS